MRQITYFKEIMTKDGYCLVVARELISIHVQESIQWNQNKHQKLSTFLMWVKEIFIKYKNETSSMLFLAMIEENCNVFEFIANHYHKGFFSRVGKDISQFLV